jgi:hypothetical protein
VSREFESVPISLSLSLSLSREFESVPISLSLKLKFIFLKKIIYFFKILKFLKF